MVNFNISCMALDWITGNIYVGDSATKSIGIIAQRPVLDTLSHLVVGELAQKGVGTKSQGPLVRPFIRAMLIKFNSSIVLIWFVRGVSDLV